MQYRTREEKENLVRQWRESGKTMAEWCREHLIPKTTLFSWVYPKKKSKAQSAIINQNQFLELQDTAPAETRVVIEYKQLKIRLGKNFDAPTLERCLQILVREKC